MTLLLGSASRSPLMFASKTFTSESTFQGVSDCSPWFFSCASSIDSRAVSCPLTTSVVSPRDAVQRQVIKQGLEIVGYAELAWVEERGEDYTMVMVV